jgi:hypothetical protein
LDQDSDYLGLDEEGTGGDGELQSGGGASPRPPRPNGGSRGGAGTSGTAGCPGARSASASSNQEANEWETMSRREREVVCIFSSNNGALL